MMKLVNHQATCEHWTLAAYIKAVAVRRAGRKRMASVAQQFVR